MGFDTGPENGYATPWIHKIHIDYLCLADGLLAQL